MWAPNPIGRELSVEETNVLARVPLAKIHRSDLVMVIRKPGGLTGESVAFEVAYDESIRVPFEYYEPDRA